MELEIQLDVVDALVAKDDLDNGKWKQLRSFVIAPGEEEGRLLFRDPPKNTEPVEIRMRSYRSAYYRTKDLNFNIALQAKANRTKAGVERETLVQAALSEERARKFSWLCTGLRHVGKGAAIQTPSEAALKALAMKGDYQWLVDQGMTLAYTDSEYGTAEELAIAALGNDGGVEEKPPADAASTAPKSSTGEN